MIDDVRIAVKGKIPVYHVGDSQEEGLTPKDITNKILEVWEDTNK